jgi:thioredoxin reductase (NADPH)
MVTAMTNSEQRRVRLFGKPHSADAYTLRDYLQRSVVAFDWVELSSDADCQSQLSRTEECTSACR